MSQILSWDYLSMCGQNNMTSLDNISAFCQQIHGTLPNGPGVVLCPPGKHTYTHTHTHTHTHTQTHTTTHHPRTPQNDHSNTPPTRHTHRTSPPHTPTYPGQAQQLSPQQWDCLRFPLCLLWSSANQDGAWKEAWSWLVERVRKITMEMKMM